jgi:hypothetical protein
VRSGCGAMAGPSWWRRSWRRRRPRIATAGVHHPNQLARNMSIGADRGPPSRINRVLIVLSISGHWRRYPARSLLCKSSPRRTYLRLVRLRFSSPRAAAAAAVPSTTLTMFSRKLAGFAGIAAKAFSRRTAPMRPSIPRASV